MHLKDDDADMHVRRVAWHPLIPKYLLRQPLPRSKIISTTTSHLSPLFSHTSHLKIHDQATLKESFSLLLNRPINTYTNNNLIIPNSMHPSIVSIFRHETNAKQTNRKNEIGTRSCIQSGIKSTLFHHHHQHLPVFDLKTESDFLMHFLPFTFTKEGDELYHHKLIHKTKKKQHQRDVELCHAIKPCQRSKNNSRLIFAKKLRAVQCMPYSIQENENKGKILIIA